jgi:ABC-type branched-subunit amino acid transport system substrate-binding protein
MHKLGALIVCLLLLAACGSTAQRTAGFTDDGTGAVASDEFGPTADAADAGGEAAPGASAKSGGVTSTTTRRAAGQGGKAAAGATQARVPGVTATEIRVGYGTQKDADQAAVAFGLQAVFGDQEGQARAIVDDINKRGGVLGRKLALVFHDDKTANDNASPDVAATAQCNDWTQDRPVFAGINIVASRNRPSYFACMAKARTPALFSDLTAHSLGDIRTYAPYLYAPGVATFQRWVPTWIQRLNARGYFSSWNATAGAPGTAPVKIGVPYQDSDTGRVYFEEVKRALSAIGRKADDSFAFAPEDANALAQIPQIVLRFKANQITHVLLPQSAYVVTPVAEQQAFRPRYALTTLDGLASLTITTSPPAQLQGALGLGWFPASDVDAAHDPGDVSANETRCKKVMEAAGFSTADRLTLTVQLINCDLFLVFADALNKAGTLSASALQQGTAALGGSFPPAFTFVELYGPGRYDGAAAGRDIGYDAGCGCFAYLDRVNRPFPA